jgi:hypothetical protein
MTHELEVKYLPEESLILSVTILCAFVPVTYEIFLSVISCSDQATGWTILGWIRDIVFFSKTSRPSLGSAQFPIQL